MAMAATHIKKADRSGNINKTNTYGKSRNTLKTRAASARSTSASCGAQSSICPPLLACRLLSMSPCCTWLVWRNALTVTAVDCTRPNFAKHLKKGNTRAYKTTSKFGESADMRPWVACNVKHAPQTSNASTQPYRNPPRADEADLSWKPRPATPTPAKKPSKIVSRNPRHKAATRKPSAFRCLVTNNVIAICAMHIGIATAQKYRLFAPDHDNSMQKPTSSKSA
mmetsp:Transcript_17373/g.50056  ORF Transcript_17373/g.50056 Transcript_17373/m.50056 type:complete len:224 (+) Transcript_17373:239-910(+)